MKLFFKRKDGGPYSKVMGYFLIEWKRVFSIALLRFDEGSREAFHSHAFNSISWVLTGGLFEQHFDGSHEYHFPDGRRVTTRRNTFHQVYGLAKTNWVLSFRGPWADQW